jgi:hypothetical protein
VSSGHIIGGPADPDYHGAVLTADLAVGDSVIHVDDVADFDEDAAERDARILLGVDSTQDGNLDAATATSLAYVTCDDDASTVTLTAPSTVAASSGDRVYVQDPISGLPVVDYVVLVAHDDGDTTGDALPVTLTHAIAAGVSDLSDLDGQSITFEEDDDGELIASDLPGLNASTGEVRGYQDALTVTALGDQILHLTYKPLPNTTVHLYWNGIFQTDDQWSRDGWDITIPDGAGIIEVGDQLVAKYLYNDPTTKPPTPDVVIDVPLTLGRRIEYATDGTFTTTDVGLPVTFDTTIYPTPTDDHIQNTYLYPLEWDGLDATTLDFVPATPAGYGLATITFAMTAHLTGGTADPITVDTSGWGYTPPPTESPNIVFGSGGGPLFDVFPSSDAEVVSGAMGTTAPTAGDFASPFRYQKWNGLVAPTPPYSADTRAIVAAAIVIRFTYTWAG